MSSAVIGQEAFRFKAAGCRKLVIVSRELEFNNIQS